MFIIVVILLLNHIDVIDLLRNIINKGVNYYRGVLSIY